MHTNINTEDFDEKIGFSEHLLQQLYDQKLLKIYLPELYGGLGLSIPEGVKLLEKLAYQEGNLGWLCTLSSGASIFGGYMNPDFAQKIFQNPRVSFAGSGKAEGKALIVDGGYLVDGIWAYASGADIATVFTANCKLYQDGVLLLDSDGNPVIKAFAFMREEVTIHPNWDGMGLRSTSGHTFEVNQLHVTPDRVFELNPETAHVKHSNYLYPFKQFAETTLAVNTLGMGLHFVDLVGDYIEQKKDLGIHIDAEFEKNYMSTQVEVEISKSKFYDVLNTSWVCLTVQNQIPAAILEDVTRESKAMIKLIQTRISQLYPYCGMQAARASSDMNKIWRDVFTASQHTALL